MNDPKNPGNQGGAAPLDPPFTLGYFRLLTDLYTARRQRRHYVLSPDDEVVFTDKNLGRCLEWLTAQGHWAVVWQNGSDYRVLTFVRPGSSLAKEIHAVWTELENRRQDAAQPAQRGPLTLDDLVETALRSPNEAAPSLQNPLDTGP